MLFIGCLLLMITTLFWYWTDPFYWRRKNVPYITPLPVFGNFISMFHCGMTEYIKTLNKTFSEYKYFGIHFFTRPVLFINDAKLIQRVLVSDFEHFTSHGFYSNQDYDPAGSSLAFVHGQQWKVVKAMLNKNFTPAKVKSMLSYVDETIPKITELIDKKIDQGENIDISTLFMTSVSDTFFKALFGVKCAVVKDMDSTISKLSELIIADKLGLQMYVGFIWPRLYDFLKLTIFGNTLNKFITNVVQKSIEFRRKENVHMPDFLQAMMELLETDCTKEVKYFPDKTRVPRYNMDYVVGQALMLYVAAVEASALSITFLFYEMARNPEIQDRCRAEINSVVKDGGSVSVDDVPKLVYLQAVLQESMRMHPPLVMLNRECTKHYTIPGTQTTIEPGTLLFIPLINAHMTDKNFPNSQVFRPERFLDEEKNSVRPGSYFPFGLGPRTCMGTFFAMNLMKLIVARLLHKYEFSICKQTQIPLRYAKFKFFTTPAENVWLQVKPITAADA